MYNAIFTHSSASTGAAAPYDFHWAAPVATTQVCATYAYEFGTTGVPYVAHGGITNSLRISGEAGSNWQFTVGGFAKDIVSLSSGLSTAAFADARSMTPVAMKDTHLRLSPFATGLYGTSSGQVDATLISFELNYNPNRHLKQFAGSVTPGNWGDGRSEGTLRTVLEFNANAKAYVDELVGDAGTVPSTGAMLQRQVQVYASATSTAGTTGFVSAIRFAGAVSSPIPLWGDRDGNLTVDITWGGKFSTAFTPIGSTDGNFLSFQISNNTSSTT